MVSNSYIHLISTFSLHGKKGDAAKSIFKMCVHFQNIKYGVQAPLVVIELTVWQKNEVGLKQGQQFHISFWCLLLVSSQQHFEIGVQNMLSFSKYSFIFKMCFHFQNVLSLSKKTKRLVSIKQLSDWEPTLEMSWFSLICLHLSTSTSQYSGCS